MLDINDFMVMREKMVLNQIEKRGVVDNSVLNAFLKVPRHLFVPEDYQNRAYRDEPLPIGDDQTISQPYIVAYMTEMLTIGYEDRVLEIGTGSGYQTAILAELAKEVFTIEIRPRLQEIAKRILDHLGYENIHFKTGDGYNGWDGCASFDKIIVTAAPSVIPDSLLTYLNDPGMMIIPAGDLIQYLFRITKVKKKINKKKLLCVRFVPMQKIRGDT